MNTNIFKYYKQSLYWKHYAFSVIGKTCQALIAIISFRNMENIHVMQV